MATVAHCFYCFEALAASLEKRDSLTLSRVQDLWAQFNETEIKEESLEQLIQAGDHLEPGQNRALRELDIEEDRPAQPVSRSDLRLPIISRLQNTSPASSSSSSTPSSLSATSSRAALTDASKSSSKTSFFSFSRRSPFSPVQKEEEEAEAEVNDLEDEEDEEGEEEEHPLFVTWNILSSRGYKSLRGCIGTFDAQDLSSGLKSYALTA